VDDLRGYYGTIGVILENSNSSPSDFSRSGILLFSPYNEREQFCLWFLLITLNGIKSRILRERRAYHESI